ncbi:MAG: PQQ-binding-like beta-propeller repeat protein [Myxococcota bacterium]
MRRHGVLLVLCAWACQEDPVLLAGASGQLQVVPDRLDVGRVFIGQTRDFVVELRAIGGAVDYTAVFGGPQGEGLSAAPGEGRIPSSRSQVFVVRLRPTETGQRSATVMFTEVDGTRTATLALTARVEAPPDCEDGNQCTDDNFDFDAAMCTSAALSGPCQDFDACTVQDTCADGLCVGARLDCDDNNACTDDFCDPRDGCLHELTRDCDDGDPCTLDLCGADGCLHADAPEGTPCGQGEQCVEAMGCRRGECFTVNLGDGDNCDDGDECTEAEACDSGECIDPDFPYPDDGELQWDMRVGPLATGAVSNPLIDVDGTIYVGVRDGVVALDSCGGVVWENRGLGLPNARSMLISPGSLTVPLESSVVELDRTSGNELGRVELQTITELELESGDRLEILDMAVRSSGALVLSAYVFRDASEGDGVLLAIPPSRSTATLLQRLGPQHARRMVVDSDEVVVAILRPGPPADDPLPVPERVVRFGLPNLPETRWTSDALDSVSSELALDGASRVLWTVGLQALGRDGFPTQLRAPPDPVARVSGSAVVDRDRAYLVVDRPVGSALLSIALANGTILWERALAGVAVASTPAVDDAGNIYVAGSQGTVQSFTREGDERYRLDLPYANEEGISVAIGPTDLAVVIGSETVFGIETDFAPANSAWPRYRRDNFGTAHR